MMITVNNTTLFQVAATWLNDATSWNLIASLNGMEDPMIQGTVTLTLPPPGLNLLFNQSGLT